jgi:membrane fusion protein (multidrug efflux system)
MIAVWLPGPNDSAMPLRNASTSQFESTDDAYITGHEHPVSFRVSGTISEVLVDDNQLLKQGDPIARLDPRDFEVALVQARAQHLQAKAQLQQECAVRNSVDPDLDGLAGPDRA